MKTLVLDEIALQQLVLRVGIDDLMDGLIDRISEAFTSYDPQRTEIPQRTGFHYQAPTGLIEWMPLHEQGKSIVIKVVGYHPENPSRNSLPTIVSTLSSYDTQTGHLAAIVDATFLTAMRTGAATCVASQLLAKSESKVLGLVGCGAQAVTQLHALSRRFRLEEVLLYDVDESAVLSLRTRMAGLIDNSIAFKAVSQEVIGRRSDMICTATSVGVGDGPVIELQDHQPDLHVNAIGSDFPGKTELSRDFLEKSFVCPDFIPQAQVEGECQQLSSMDEIVSISDVAKTPDLFAPVKQQATVFDSTGWALEDWVAMEMVIELAKQHELGSYLSIESLSGDPRNPYEFLSSPVLRQHPAANAMKFSGSSDVGSTA